MPVFLRSSGAENQPFFYGREIHVKPYSGSDSHDGSSMSRAVKTLTKALSLATANHGDVVYLHSESNTASQTTDYQSSALDWNKDGVALIGDCAGNSVSQRSRIAWISTMTATSDTILFTVSANNCYIANIQIFCGIGDANLSFCTKVSGDRNKFYNVHFAGIGHATNDAAGAYSLLLSGGDENVFERCTIGLDTIARGTAANSELLFASGATRNKFIDCDFITYAEAATHQFVIVPASSIDRWTLFRNCAFINMPTGIASGTTMTEALDVTAGGSPDGCLVLKDCSFYGVGDVEAATVSGKVLIHGAAVTAADNSLGGANAAS